jgi:DNA-binding CsgD family transcriptional regulator
MSSQPQADFPGAISTLPHRANESLADVNNLLLNELGCAIVLVDPRAALLQANRAGHAELARCNVLGVTGGRIYALASQDGQILRGAIDRAVEGKRGLINLRASGRELSVVLVPIPGPGGHRVALYFARSEVCEATMLGFFANTYRLTPAEEQVLGILVQGYNAPEAAVLLNVAVSTVRSHVRNMCSKTQSNGIRELVSRVAVLPPVAPACAPEQVH